MYKSVERKDYGEQSPLYPLLWRLNLRIESVLGAILPRLVDESQKWDAASLSAALREEVSKLGIKSKDFMTVLRCQLTGMKVRMT